MRKIKGLDELVLDKGTQNTPSPINRQWLVFSTLHSPHPWREQQRGDKCKWQQNDRNGSEWSPNSEICSWKKMFSASSERCFKQSPELIRVVFSVLFAESLIPPSFQLHWLGLAPQLTAVCSITLLCNFTCRYLTPCLIRLSPMPSCTCPGRRAVTPSPLLAARGPWRSSTPCNQQRNVSPMAQGAYLQPLCVLLS